MLLKEPPLDWHGILATSHVTLWVWALTGILFAGNEFWAVWKGRQYATFTTIVKKGVPRWLVAAILGWLVYHFLIAS